MPTEPPLSAFGAKKLKVMKEFGYYLWTEGTPFLLMEAV
jgi:hypothetical protein